MTPADQKAENDKTVAAFVEAAKVAVERLQTAVRTSERSVAALRQTRGEPPTDAEILAHYCELFEVPEWAQDKGHPKNADIVKHARALLAKWGGAGLSEPEVRERERKAVQDFARSVQGMIVSDARKAAATFFHERGWEAPAPPAVPSVTCERCGGGMDFSEPPNGPVIHYNRDDCIRFLAARVRQEGR